jgi:potassium channel subfamily K protein 1
LIGEIVSANDRGVSVAANGTSVSSWSFGQSFFFASTVVTTIGKSNMLAKALQQKL